MDDEEPGVPEWVVTYGDMMSLLLTFFIMLVSLSDVVADSKYRAILDALQQYIGYRTAPKSPPGKNFPLNSLIAKMGTLGSFSDVNEGKGGITTLAPAGVDLRVRRTREGNALRVGRPLVFEPNEIALSEAAKRELSKIADVLGGKPNKIEIRSHSSPQFDSSVSSYLNLVDLTYARARAVLDFLIELKIDRKRIRIIAAADSEPLPKSGDHRSRQLDRVDIRILDAFADEFVGPKPILE